VIGVLRLQARRDRLQLTVWIVAIVVFGAFSAAASRTEYGDTASRSSVLRLALVTPSLLALRGNPYGPTYGSAVWFQVFAFLAVTIGLMNTFLATRHGRGDEERGRRELVAATPIRRTDPIVATLLLGVAANLLLGVLLGAGLVAVGLPASGAPVAGATFAGVGLAFFGLAMLVSELSPTGRSANGIGVTIVLVAYAVRGAGDALGTPDLARISLTAAWPTWLSPIGWGEQTFAFTANRPAPLWLFLALFALSSAAAVILRARRDLGASLLQERPGRPAGGPLLRGAGGLLARLAWPVLTAWTVGTALLALLLGPLTQAVQKALFADAPVTQVLRALGHATSTTGLFVSLIMTGVGALAGAAALQTVLRLREEESAGHAEALLATPLSRVRWLGTTVLGGWVSAALPVTAAAIAGWASLVAYGKQAEAAHALAQAFAELPAALVFAGIAALVAAAVPRAAIAAGWSAYALAIVLGLFGPLLKLPDWLQRISPIADVPTTPVDDWLSTVLLIAVAVALPVLAGIAFRSRVFAA
jgi:ABC-2 type transport system permease protein